MFHTAARTSPTTTTRRENVGVAKNSRIAKRYAMPAIVKEAMKYGPPRSPKLREQMASATHNAAPSMYTLHSRVISTILPYPPETVPAQVPSPGTSPYKALIPRAFVTLVQFDRFLTFLQDIILGMETDQLVKLGYFNSNLHFFANAPHLQREPQLASRSGETIVDSHLAGLLHSFSSWGNA